jgi:predicted kinase
MIVVVLGLPGTGKSYFAEKLANQLGAVHINSDRLRNARRAQGKYTIGDKLLIYRGMADKTGQALDQGKSVIVDATFYKCMMIDLFMKLAKDHESPIRFIKIEADETLVQARLRRARTDSEADFQVYLKIKDEFEELYVPHLTLQSQADNINTMIESAVQYIDDVHE